MLKRIDDTHTLHSLTEHGGYPLGVECTGCGRRGLALRKQADTFKGRTQRLITLKCVCSSCGSRGWIGWIFTNRSDVLGFMGMEPGTSPLFY